jgi:hypothetical protein
MVAALAQKAENMAVAIRRADHAPLYQQTLALTSPTSSDKHSTLTTTLPCAP